MKRVVKRFSRKIKNALIILYELFKLPHIIVSIVLLICTVISIIVSKNTQQQFPLLSSVLANVFAGLITGIAICLISGSKNLFNYKTEKLIAFLNEVHTECLAFLNDYQAILIKVSNTNKPRDGLSKEIYDVLCKGNDIDCIISQSRYDKTLPFNSYLFFVKDMDYDAAEQRKMNDMLRERVLLINEETVTVKEFNDLFSEMQRRVWLLNKKTFSKIKELEVRKNNSGKFIM